MKKLELKSNQNKLLTFSMLREIETFPERDRTLSMSPLHRWGNVERDQTPKAVKVGDYIYWNKDIFFDIVGDEDQDNLQIKIMLEDMIHPRVVFKRIEEDNVFRVEAVLDTLSCRSMVISRAGELFLVTFDLEVPSFFGFASQAMISNDLISLVKELGFENGKNNFFDLDKCEPGIKGDHPLVIDRLEFSIEFDWLCDGFGNVIYKEGAWATILDENSEEEEEEVDPLKDLLEALRIGFKKKQ